MNVQPFFDPFPTIDLGDIILREITKEDAQAYLDYMRNDQMAGFFVIPKAAFDLGFYNGPFHDVNMRESFFTLGLIAGSRVNPVKFTDLLNYHSNDGWEVVAMEKESRRSFLIFKREAFIVILKRKKGASNE
jgi:hypothetical protein